VYFAPPLTGFPLDLGVGAKGQKATMMGLPDGQNSFKIGLAITGVWQTDAHTDAHMTTANSAYA